MSQIKIKDVSFGYNQDLILKNINFQEEKGEIVAIHGENGSGKSTLLKLLLGQLKPACGEKFCCCRLCTASSKFQRDNFSDYLYRDCRSEFVSAIRFL